MSIRNLFEKGRNKVLSQSQIDKLKEDLESEQLVRNAFKQERRTLAHIDYSEPSNFAFHGSAEKYYRDSFERIYKTYPYDGSLSEKKQWHIDSSDLDLWILHNIYPKNVGYLRLGSGQSVLVKGGPNNTPGVTPEDKEELSKQYPVKKGNSNIWNPSINRNSNIFFNGALGNTIEFWCKLDPSLIENATDFIPITAGNENGVRLQIKYNTGTSLLSFKYIDDSGGGLSGVDGQITIDNLFESEWNHFAFSFDHHKTKMRVQVYKNMALSGVIKAGTYIDNEDVSHSDTYLVINGESTSVSNPVSNTVDGFFIDEFRFWKVRRSHQDIGRYWFTFVHGGTNTDNDKYRRDNKLVDLGIYYKFNEGYTKDQSRDSIALDYSGRISNGEIISYTESVRSFVNSSGIREPYGSAIDESGFFDVIEEKDPVIYSDNPILVELMTEYEVKGKSYDHLNNSSMYLSIPNWIIEEDDAFGGNILDLTQVLSSYFDSAQVQISQITELKSSEYHSLENTNDVPYPLVRNALESKGMITPDLFVEATAFEEILSRGEQFKFEKKIENIKRVIYQNIYNNLPYIYKSKGTEKSFRNLLRCFGVDDEVIKINLYANEQDLKLEHSSSPTAAKKKFVDFNNAARHSGVIYTKSNPSEASSVSYIKGLPQDKDTSISMTFQTEVVFPHVGSIKEDPDYYGYTTPIEPIAFVGEYDSVNDEYLQEQVFNIKAVKVGNQNNAESVYIVLQCGDITLQSDSFRGAYDNNRLNIAVRLVPQDTVLSLAEGAGQCDYNLEMYCISSSGTYVQFEDFKSSPISRNDAMVLLKKNKFLSIGSFRDFYLPESEGVANITRLKFASTLFWYDNVTNEEVKLHSQDVLNFGRMYPSENAYVLDSDIHGSVQVPRKDTLALHWDFEDISTTDASGAIFVTDVSEETPSGQYGWFTDLVGANVTGKGIHFSANDAQIVNREFVHSARQKAPESINPEDLIQIRQFDDEIYKKDPDIVRYFFAIEKSMYQVINDDIINFFASIKEFNDLIGQPVNRYRMQYKSLEKFRGRYFERIKNVPSLEKYIEIFKWLDSSIGMMIYQLIPASSAFSSGLRTMIESHMLERNKYWNKFPTLEMSAEPPLGIIRGINELTYNWKDGSAPISVIPPQVVISRKTNDVRGEIEIGDIPSLEFGDGTTDSAFSISGFVYIPEIADATSEIVQSGAILMKEDEFRFDFVRFGSRLQINFILLDDSIYDLGNEGRLFARRSKIVASSTESGLGSLPPGWVHLAVTYDGSSSPEGIHLYIDGVEQFLFFQEGEQDPYVAMEPTNSVAKIARSGTGVVPTYYSNIAVFDTELTVSQVTEIYKNHDSSAYDSAIARWILQNDYQDSIGTLHGTPQGDVSFTDNPAYLTNFLWFDKRVRGDDPNVSTGDTEINKNRETIRRISTRSTEGNSRVVERNGEPVQEDKPILRTSSGQTYEAQAYVTRALAKPYKLNLDISDTIHGGVNYSPTTKDPNAFVRAKTRFIPGADETGISITIANNPVTYEEWKKLHTVKRSVNISISDAELDFISTHDGDLIYPYYGENFKDPSPFIVGHHNDSYGDDAEIPAQGPFTETWVGGNQHRHVHHLVGYEREEFGSATFQHRNTTGVITRVVIPNHEDFSFTSNTLPSGDSSALEDYSAAISFWVKPRKNTTMYLLGKFDSPNHREWYVYLFHGSLYFTPWNHNGNSTAFNTVNSPIVMTSDEWYHVVINFQASLVPNSSKVEFWINGELNVVRTEISGGYSGMRQTSSPLVIGARDQSTQGQTLEGEMRDVAIFNFKDQSTALSEEDITELYNNNIASHPRIDNLVGWWKLYEDATGYLDRDGFATEDVVFNGGVKQLQTARPELYINDNGTLKHPREVSTDQLAARYTREEVAKRPLNIKNIKTDSSTEKSPLGNYTRDYEIVQTSGRTINNGWLRDLSAAQEAALGVKPDLLSYWASFQAASQDYIEIPNSETLSFVSEADDNLDSPFSWSFWAKFDVDPMSLDDEDAVHLIEKPGEYIIKWSSEYGWSIELYDASVYAYSDLFPQMFTPQINTWYHIVITYNGDWQTDAEDSIKFYINGTLIQDLAGTVPTYDEMIAKSNSLRIGSGFPGKLYNVSLYDKELTSQEASLLYNDNYPNSATPMNCAVSWWSMSGDARDYFNRNHGFLSKGAASSISFYQNFDTIGGSTYTADGTAFGAKINRVPFLFGPRQNDFYKNVYSDGYTIPPRKAQKHVFVEKFSSPGDSLSSTPVRTDPFSGEYGIYNTANYRNLEERTKWQEELYTHSDKYLDSSGYKYSNPQLPVASIHKINRNRLFRPTDPGCKSNYDNAYISHQIPRSDLQYYVGATSIDESKYRGELPGITLEHGSAFFPLRSTMGDSAPYDSGIVVPDHSDLSMVDSSGNDVPYTIAFWLRMDASVSHSQGETFLHKSAIGLTSDGNDEWSFWSLGSGYGWRFEIESNNIPGFHSSSKHFTSSVGPDGYYRIFEDYDLGQWMHVAMTFNPHPSDGTDLVRFYKNGQFWSEDNGGNGYLNYDNMGLANDVPLLIGRSSNENHKTQKLEGQMSNLIMFKHDGQNGRGTSVLTDAEIAELHSLAQYETFSKYEDAVAWFKLYEDANSEIGNHQGVATDVAFSTASAPPLATSGPYPDHHCGPGTDPVRFSDYYEDMYVVKGDEESGAPYADFQGAGHRFIRNIENPKVVRQRAVNTYQNVLRSDESLSRSYIEPAVQWNKPYMHDILTEQSVEDLRNSFEIYADGERPVVLEQAIYSILRRGFVTNSRTRSNRVQAVAHSYINNLEMFSNADFNQDIDLTNESPQFLQTLNTLFERGDLLYTSSTFKEIIMPKHRLVGTAIVRNRTKFDTYKVFWRNKFFDRVKIENKSKLGYTVTSEFMKLFRQRYSVDVMDNYYHIAASLNSHWNNDFNITSARITFGTGTQIRSVLGWKKSTIRLHGMVTDTSLEYVFRDFGVENGSIDSEGRVQVVTSNALSATPAANFAAAVTATLGSDFNVSESDSVVTISHKSTVRGLDTMNPIKVSGGTDRMIQLGYIEIDQFNGGHVEKFNVLGDLAYFGEDRNRHFLIRRDADVDFVSGLSKRTTLFYDDAEPTLEHLHPVSSMSFVSYGDESLRQERSPIPSPQIIHNPCSSEYKESMGWVNRKNLEVAQAVANGGDLSMYRPPNYNSYEEFSEDLIAAAQNYSIIPEYRISEHVDYHMLERDGNWRSINYNFLTIDGASYDRENHTRSSGKLRDYSTVTFYSPIEPDPGEANPTRVNSYSEMEIYNCSPGYRTDNSISVPPQSSFTLENSVDTGNKILESSGIPGFVSIRPLSTGNNAAASFNLSDNDDFLKINFNKTAPGTFEELQIGRVPTAVSIWAQPDSSSWTTEDKQAGYKIGSNQGIWSISDGTHSVNLLSTYTVSPAPPGIGSNLTKGLTFAWDYFGSTYNDSMPERSPTRTSRSTVYTFFHKNGERAFLEPDKMNNILVQFLPPEDREPIDRSTQLNFLLKVWLNGEELYGVHIGELSADYAYRRKNNSTVYYDTYNSRTTGAVPPGVIVSSGVEIVENLSDSSDKILAMKGGVDTLADGDYPNTTGADIGFYRTIEFDHDIEERVVFSFFPVMGRKASNPDEYYGLEEPNNEQEEHLWVQYKLQNQLDWVTLPQATTVAADITQNQSATNIHWDGNYEVRVDIDEGQTESNPLRIRLVSVSTYTDNTIDHWGIAKARISRPKQGIRGFSPCPIGEFSPQIDGLASYNYPWIEDYDTFWSAQAEGLRFLDSASSMYIGNCDHFKNQLDANTDTKLHRFVGYLDELSVYHNTIFGNNAASLIYNDRIPSNVAEIAANGLANNNWLSGEKYDYDVGSYYYENFSGQEHATQPLTWTFNHENGPAIGEQNHFMFTTQNQLKAGGIKAIIMGGQSSNLANGEYPNTSGVDAGNYRTAQPDAIFYSPITVSFKVQEGGGSSYTPNFFGVTMKQPSADHEESLWVQYKVGEGGVWTNIHEVQASGINRPTTQYSDEPQEFSIGDVGQSLEHPLYLRWVTLENSATVTSPVTNTVFGNSFEGHWAFGDVKIMSTDRVVELIEVGPTEPTDHEQLHSNFGRNHFSRGISFLENNYGLDTLNQLDRQLIAWHRIGVPEHSFQRKLYEWDKEFLDTYAMTDSVKYIGEAVDEESRISQYRRNKKIKITLNTVKKLLPYEGFYPQDRTVQIADLFVQKIKDDILPSSSYAANGKQIYKEQAIQAAMQHFFAPGILYNSIKAGLACDWASYTNYTGMEPSYFGEPIEVLNESGTGERHQKRYSKSLYPHWYSSLTLYGTFFGFDLREAHEGRLTDNIPTVENDVMGMDVYPFQSPHTIANDQNYVVDIDGMTILSPPTTRLPFEAILDPYRFLVDTETVYYTPEGYDRKILRKPSQFFLMAPSYYKDFLSMRLYPTGSTGALQEYDKQNIKGNYEKYAFPYFEIDSANGNTDFRYELAINNFLAESVRFFLKGDLAGSQGNLTRFISKREDEFRNFKPGDTYYMNVRIAKRGKTLFQRTPHAKKYSSHYALTNIQGGRYYGPPTCWYYNPTRIGPSDKEYLHREPAFAPYVPPYHYGSTTAIIQFTATASRHTIDDIHRNAVVTYTSPSTEGYFEQVAEQINSTDLEGNNLEQGNMQQLWRNLPAYQNRMPMTASIDLFGKSRGFARAIGSDGAEEARESAGTSLNSWVISTRYECPVFNFGEANRTAATEMHEMTQTLGITEELREHRSTLRVPHSSSYQYANYLDHYVSNLDKFNYEPTDRDALGGTGIWSALGESGDNMLIMSIDDAYDEGISLAFQCGFESQTKSVGVVAEERKIKEAVVMIPIIDTQNREMWMNDLDGLKVIDLPTFHEQKNKYEAGVPIHRKSVLVRGGDGADLEFQEQPVMETSVTDLIRKMREYIIPPRFNFDENDNIRPFAMYIFEYEHVLSRKDLENIWQGIQPEIARRAVHDVDSIEHDIGPYEVLDESVVGLGGDLLEAYGDKLKWLTFKVKQKAEKSYYNVIENDAAENRFRVFRDGRFVVPKYGYNYPYDYFTMIDRVQCEVQIKSFSTYEYFESKLREDSDE